MNKKVEKFLQFNGKKILFVGKDGVWWIAIKPICEALNVEYTRIFKNIKEDSLLSEPLAVQPIVAADGKMRKMSCLPEFFVYGWLMGIQSESKELKEYKWECYRVLYEHFHGAIGGRKDLLKEKARSQVELDKIRNQISTEHAIAIDKYNKRINAINAKLRQMDGEILREERDLFSTL